MVGWAKETVTLAIPQLRRRACFAAALVSVRGTWLPTVPRIESGAGSAETTTLIRASASSQQGLPGSRPRGCSAKGSG
jgi:hypothetical protein